jgi:two-component system sensor histidine kinase ResE
MPLTLIWLLLIILLVSVFAFFYYLHVKTTANLKKTLELKELEFKHQAYETQLLDIIHQKFGYVVEVPLVLDTLVESLSSIIGFTAVSYVLVTPTKLRFRFHMFEKVSGAYLETVKAKLLDETLQDYTSLQIQSSMEETISGNVITDALTFLPASYIDIPIVINDIPLGFLTITSQRIAFYSQNDITLVQKSIQRVFQEISRLKKLIDEEKTKLDVLVDNMDSGVMLIREDFTVVAINSTCVGLLGLTSKEDTTIFDVVGAFSNIIPLDEALAEVFKQQIHKNFPNISFKDKYLNITIVPINSTVTKKAAGILVNDRTDEHNFNQMKDDFFSMIVHELRSPLTIIKGTSDMLIKRGDSFEKDQSTTMLTQIRDDSTRLLNLVSDLLDSAKIEAGKITILKKVADINKLILKQVTDFMPIALEKQITLSVDTDSRISVFNFDGDRIEQVLTNLISNALKFTSEGSIHVSSTLVEDFVEVSIADTGLGIDDEEKQKLFNKYMQLHEPKTKEKGTGLGLVISKGIVEAHGGQIWVSDNKPHGSVFRFKLPVVN